MAVAGFIVHRASRTERLADALADALEAERPPHPLRAQCIVVAHPGLKRWLLDRFARRSGRSGAPGIAANYDLLLPGEWLERQRHAVLAEDAAATQSWRQDVLRWRIHDVLRGFAHPALGAWLAGADADTRRFELADRMAALYTQYLIYRPDWIAEWERTPPPAADWQAALWKMLRGTIVAPHRAQRSAALAAALRERGDGEPGALPVFGVSHLPGDVLAALRALARHRPVHLYFPDPCREHWVYLRRQRDLLRIAADPQALHYEVGHPLLVAFGRMAQDFCLALDAVDADERRDADDDSDAPPADNLLAQLQASIRRMQPDLVGAHARTLDETERAAWLLARRADASLRVHACHTPLRELEVLRDALLGFLADDATLQYADVVVMAPDIGRFAPYLGAVFGEGGRGASGALQLPWHLADTGLMRTHALIGAFARVLDAGDSRFSVSDVLGLLDVPALARRFGVDADARTTLERWLRRAHVAWGLDAAMKAHAGAAALLQNTWQFGFDRLYAGLASGNTGGEQLVDGVLPLDGLGGSAIEALGALDRLLGELRRARDMFAGARPLADWCAWLDELVERLFRIDPADAAERGALDAVVRTVGTLAREAALAESRAALAWPVVRSALHSALDAVPERQPFLLGGVTFCGLVPQRSIPFRVVCLIGMNEGDFPRGALAAGINRMAAAPRRGDRDTRSEDRYLFLEALMAARARLHVSYVGRDAQDGKGRNPAAPLAELLQFLDEQHGIAGSADAERPWCVAHPLQPFARRYFAARDPRLFAFDARLAAFERGTRAAKEPAFFEFGAAPAPPAARAVAISELVRFWRDPARATLRDGAGISLQALDSGDPPDREPLAARFERIARVEARLFDAALAAGWPQLPAAPPDWLARSGELPAGRAGAVAFADARAAVDAALLLARQSPAFAGGAIARRPQAVDVDLGDGARLTGIVERVFAGSDGVFTVFAARVVGAADFRHLLPLYIEYAALRLQRQQPLALHFVADAAASAGTRRVIGGVLDAVRAQTPAQLRAGLRTLLTLRGDGLQPLPFLPVSAWAYACAAPAERLARARQAWSNRASEHGEESGEREFAPGYAALLLRGLEPYAAGGAPTAQLARVIATVCAVLDPDGDVLLAADPPVPAAAAPHA